MLTYTEIKERRNTKLENVVLNNLSWFITKYNNLIEYRLKEIEKEVKEKRVWENLWGSFNRNKVRNGIIWELIFAVYFKWKMCDELFSEYDILLNGKNYDIKTLTTKQDLNSKLDHLKLYLQADQIKENVNYIPCLLNYTSNKALLIWDSKLNWELIIWNLESKFENPPFTEERNLVNNYVIPYNTFYKK